MNVFREILLILGNKSRFSARFESKITKKVA